jgi:hypothetical protein
MNAQAWNFKNYLIYSGVEPREYAVLRSKACLRDVVQLSGMLSPLLKVFPRRKDALRRRIDVGKRQTSSTYLPLRNLQLARSTPKPTRNLP